MNKKYLAIAIIVLAVIAGGVYIVSQKKGEDGMGTVPTAANLDGSTFTLTSYNGAPVSGDRKYTLTFDKGSVSAKFCNGLGGEYTLKGGMISGNLFGTQISCTQPSNIMELEAAFGAMFNEGAKILLQGNTLALTTSTTKMVFVKN
jgi:heat shock protein HslJ